MKQSLRRGVWLLLVMCVITLPAFGQKEKRKEKENDWFGCNEGWNNQRLVNHCEMKEQTIPASDISVDGRMNGGVSIKGWERNEVLVRARIQTAATSQAAAEELARQIKVETASAKIFATGPDNQKDAWWSVSYEIFVPQRSNVSVKTHNGGISFSDVNGRLEFSALNGGVNLRHVGGSVKGSTTNGGLNVELTGNRWEGEALDVRTTNGGVSLSIPSNYSAHLETGTVNGRISVDFPITMQGDITKEVAVNLGSGGPTIRAMTTNGGVRISRSEGMAF